MMPDKIPFIVYKIEKVKYCFIYLKFMQPTIYTIHPSFHTINEPEKNFIFPKWKRKTLIPHFAKVSINFLSPSLFKDLHVHFSRLSVERNLWKSFVLASVSLSLSHFLYCFRASPCSCWEMRIFNHNLCSVNKWYGICLISAHNLGKVPTYISIYSVKHPLSTSNTNFIEIKSNFFSYRITFALILCSETVKRFSVTPKNML